MIAVGAVAVYVWRRRAEAMYFLFGAVSWAVAIAVKIVLDLTVTPSFKALLPETLAGVLVLGLYYGLRTGFFESGIPWAAARLAKLKPTFDQAVAVGIGAGAAEAIALGLLSLLSVLTFILVPGLVDTFSPATQDALQLQFSIPFVPIPVWERLFALFCHVFAMALAMYALRAGRRWLALSIAFMALLDGALIPLFAYVTTRTFVDNLVIETFVGTMGLASIAGLFILRGIYDRHAPQA